MGCQKQPINIMWIQSSINLPCVIEKPDFRWDQLTFTEVWNYSSMRIRVVNVHSPASRHVSGVQTSKIMNKIINKNRKYCFVTPPSPLIPADKLAFNRELKSVMGDWRTYGGKYSLLPFSFCSLRLSTCLSCLSSSFFSLLPPLSFLTYASLVSISLDVEIACLHMHSFNFAGKKVLLEPTCFNKLALLCKFCDAILLGSKNLTLSITNLLAKNRALKILYKQY